MGFKGAKAHKVYEPMRNFFTSVDKHSNVIMGGSPRFRIKALLTINNSGRRATLLKDRGDGWLEIELDENRDGNGEPFAERSVNSKFVTFDAGHDGTTIIQYDGAYDNAKGKEALDNPTVDLSTIDVLDYYY